MRTQRVRVIERAVAATKTGSSGNGMLDIGPRAVDGALEILALRQARGDRGGEGAAGAMGMTRLDPLVFPDPDPGAADENIRHGRSRQMTALHQHRPTAELEQGLTRGAHLGDTGDPPAA